MVVVKRCLIILALVLPRTLERAAPELIRISIILFTHMLNRYNSLKITSTTMKTNKAVHLLVHSLTLVVDQVLS